MDFQNIPPYICDLVSLMNNKEQGEMGPNKHRPWGFKLGYPAIMLWNWTQNRQGE